MIVVDSSVLIAILEEESDAVKRLEILAAATSLNDLRTLPSNHREALKDDRENTMRPAAVLVSIPSMID